MKFEVKLNIGNALSELQFYYNNESALYILGIFNSIKMKNDKVFICIGGYYHTVIKNNILSVFKGGFSQENIQVMYYEDYDNSINYFKTDGMYKGLLKKYEDLIESGYKEYLMMNFPLLRCDERRIKYENRMYT